MSDTFNEVSHDDAEVIPAPARGGARQSPARQQVRATRAQQSRAANQRRGVGGDHKGRLHIDPSLLDPGREYTWIREESLGERDKGNIQDALDNQGYDPVSAKDHPALAGRTLPGWEDKDSLVRRGGLVLMSRPKEIAASFREELARENEDALNSVTRQHEEQLSKGDPRYLQKMREGGVAVETVRGDTGTGKRERFQDA